MNKIKTKEDLQNLKSEFLGKNGFVTNEFKKMGQFNLDQKKEFSIQLNEIKNSTLFNATPVNVEVDSSNLLIDGRPHTTEGKIIALNQAKEQFKKKFRLEGNNKKCYLPKSYKKQIFYISKKKIIKLGNEVFNEKINNEQIYVNNIIKN